MARDKDIVNFDACASRATQPDGVPIVYNPIVARGKEEHQIFGRGPRLKRCNGANRRPFRLGQSALEAPSAGEPEPPCCWLGLAGWVERIREGTVWINSYSIAPFCLTGADGEHRFMNEPEAAVVVYVDILRANDVPKWSFLLVVRTRGRV